MKLLLHRTSYQSGGVLSKVVVMPDFLEHIPGIEADNGEIATPPFCVALEHSYEGKPKLLPGTYMCVRGTHRLHGMTEGFVTFEVTGVIGHSGILFHWGNFNKDSDGCILLGHTIQDSPQGTMVTDSRATFAKFMSFMDGVDQFQLEVVA